jgi:hypothetical protein
METSPRTNTAPHELDGVANAGAESSPAPTIEALVDHAVERNEALARFEEARRRA